MKSKKRAYEIIYRQFGKDRGVDVLTGVGVAQRNLSIETIDIGRHLGQELSCRFWRSSRSERKRPRPKSGIKFRVGPLKPTPNGAPRLFVGNLDKEPTDVQLCTANSSSPGSPSPGCRGCGEPIAVHAALRALLAGATLAVKSGGKRPDKPAYGT